MASCSAPKLYQQGVDKINKAIQKDSTLAFPTDTLRLTEYDTIPGVDGKDSIIIQTNTVQLPCDFDVDAFIEANEKKTGRELRHERKMYRLETRRLKDSLVQMNKSYKLETKRLEDSLVQMNKHYKQEVKVLKSDNQTEVKLARQETKQKKGSWFQRQMSKIWWLLLIIGIAVGFYLRGLIPTISNPFKRNSS